MKSAGAPNLAERLAGQGAPALLWYANLQHKRGVDYQPRFIRREFPEKSDYWRQNAADVFVNAAMEKLRVAVTHP
jgi:hypothetical protein